MKNIIKKIVIIAITVCIILSEWGTYGLNVNASDSGLSISGASTIKKIKKGSAWTCKGTVSSNYILKEVRGTIYESDGLTVKYRKSAYPNSNTYVLQNGEIDKALLFNKLQAGVYYYTIVATDASGTTKTLVNNKIYSAGKRGINAQDYRGKQYKFIKTRKSLDVPGDSQLELFAQGSEGYNICE